MVACSAFPTNLVYSEDRVLTSSKSTQDSQIFKFGEHLSVQQRPDFYCGSSMIVSFLQRTVKNMNISR